jgi:hypothetical protein
MSIKGPIEKLNHRQSTKQDLNVSSANSSKYDYPKAFDQGELHSEYCESVTTTEPPKPTEPPMPTESPARIKEMPMTTTELPMPTELLTPTEPPARILENDQN